MEAIKIRIVTSTVLNDTIYEVLAGRTTLFFFKHTATGGWGFFNWGGKRLTTWDSFPADYFEKLCKAMAFIEFNLEDFPEIEITKKDRKFLDSFKALVA